ncbi:MAG: FAD-dependent monooxygenase [Hyphomicrobiaceae bacterium]
MAETAADARRITGSLSAVIVGGGIGGLAAALALAARGIPSTVLERRQRFEAEGAGIQLGPNGTRILRQLGVADLLEPQAGKPDCIHTRDASSGATLTRLPLGAWIAQRHGAPYWVVHRADLHEALLKRVQGEPLVTMRMDFDAGAIRATDGPGAPGGVMLTERMTGTVAAGSIAIAADGIRSRVRDLLFDGPPLQFAAKSAARAVIPADAMPPALSENATAIWLSPSAHVVHYPVRAGREIAIVFVRRDRVPSDDWSTAVSVDWVRDAARDFAAPLRALLAAPDLWKKWALYTLPPMARWTSGRVALLGDAAHPTLPFLAQGGVLALEDAAVLAQRLAMQPDEPAAALAAYEAARKPRTTRVVAEAERNGRIYHLDGVMAAARNLAMKLTPPERLMARYDWVYGWQG